MGWASEGDDVIPTIQGSVNLTQIGSNPVTYKVEDNPVTHRTFTCQHGKTYPFYDDPTTQAQINVIVVGVDGIEVNEDGNWTDRTGSTIEVIAGTDLQFRARPNPSNARWPDGCPIWGGAAAGKSGAQITCIFNTAGTYSVIAGPDNKTVTVEVISFSTNEYKAGSDGDDYYKPDGGGVGGKVCYNEEFNYRAMFNKGPAAPHTHDANPKNIAWDVYDCDGINNRINSGTGKAHPETISNLGSARVRFYIDENLNGEYNWWFGGDEPSASSNFNVAEPVVIQLTVAYDDTIASSPDEIRSALQNKLDDAQEYVSIRQDKDDYRALVRYEITDVFSFAAPVHTITTEQHLYQLFGAVNANVIMAESIDREAMDDLDGAALGAEIIIDSQSAADSHAHEIGHTRDLGDIGPYPLCDACNYTHELLPPDNPWNKKLIMYHHESQISPRSYLRLSEATNYE